MTPMIDMSFLLITFFVMTLRLSASAQHAVVLPRADQAHATHQAQLAIVTLVVEQDGRVFWGDRELGRDAIEQALVAQREAYPQVKVVLRADARAPFERVRGVMRAAAEAGVEQIAITALKEGEATS